MTEMPQGNSSDTHIAARVVRCACPNGGLHGHTVACPTWARAWVILYGSVTPYWWLI